MSPRSTGAQLLAATALMCTAALLPASPASAHVTVSPAGAVPGGYAHLAFNVPAERQYVETTRVEIVFPPEYPLTSVATKPVPGWTVTVDKVKAPSPKAATGDPAAAGAPAMDDDDAGGAPVTAIIWQGGSIAYGEYQTFEISVGKLPDKPAKLVFKALQTYSDDQVVRWIDVAADGAPEPAHPAPVLTVAHSAFEAVGGPAGLSTEDGAARLLAIVALVGAIVAVIAPVALPRLRRRRASESTEVLDEEPVPVVAGAKQP